MEKLQEPTGVPAVPLQNPSDVHPIFICYRQIDGKDRAGWVYETLVKGLDACGDKTFVYWDQVAPATSDWTAIHQPALQRACCLIVILTPGLCVELGGDDWVHKELDWWLGHRKAAPILVDTTDQEGRWIPPKIKSRWPREQRVNLAPDLWKQAKKEEQEQHRAQVAQQLIGAIKDSGLEVLEQIHARARHNTWAVRGVASVAAAAGLGYLVYMQTGLYQINTILKSTLSKVVAENYQPNSQSGWAVRDYMRALAAYRPEAAQRAAQQIVNMDARMAALISIAKGQVDAGQKGEAAETLKEALRTAQKIQEPYAKAMALVSIAEGQVGAGQMEEAGKTSEEALRTAQSTDPRLDALFWVAEGQAKARQFVDADRTTQQIKDPSAKTLALVSIAEEEVRASQKTEAGKTLARALLTARDIKDDPDTRNRAMVEIADGQSKAGQFTQADRTAGQIADKSVRSDALSFIVRAEAEAGLLPEAEHTAERITDPTFRENALSYMAVGQARSGHFAEAERTAQKIADANMKAVTLYWIVDVAARDGQFAEAEHTARQITESANKTGALISIAEGYAQADRIPDAERTVENIEEASRNGPRVWLAEAQARAGMWKAALTTADPCPSDYKLRAYAAILNQFQLAKSKPPKPKATLRLTEGDY